MKFFVYGTLRDPQTLSNLGLVLTHSEDAWMHYAKLYATSSVGFPFMVHTNNANDIVKGLLIELKVRGPERRSVLEVLDLYEGAIGDNSLYDRLCLDGAYYYVANLENRRVKAMIDKCEEVKGGDWYEFRGAQ